MDIRRWHYYRHNVWPVAKRGFTVKTLPRVGWGILVMVCTAVIPGAVVGAITASAWAGVVGGASSLLLAGFVVLLWRLLSAPAEIHADQVSRIGELVNRCAALEGPQILLSDDLERVSLNFAPAKWSGSAHQISIILRCHRTIPGPFALSVLADAAIECGGAHLATPRVQEDGTFELLSHRLCQLRFEGPLEIPDPRVEVISEEPPTYVQRDALLTLWIGSKVPVEFREIRIEAMPQADQTATTAPAPRPPSSSGSSE